MADFSIASQIRPFQLPDQLQQYAQINQIAMQQAQMAKAQSDAEAQNKLRSLDRNSPEFVNQLYALDPAKGLAYEKGLLEMAETKRKRSEASTTTRAESQVKVLDNAYAPFTRLVNSVQSPDDAAAFVTALYKHPILGAEAVKIKPVEQAIQDSQREFAADPDKWRLLHGNLDGKTIYQISQAATAPKIEKIDLGGAIKFIDMNPKSATFKQEIGDFTKTPVPRVAAPEQTSSVEEPAVNNLAPAPLTSAANAQVRGPVQLAMLNSGASPLIQMMRPMPSEGGVTAPAPTEGAVTGPTKTAARKRSAEDSALPPGLKLKQGERYNPETERVEAIPGSDLYIAQSQKHQKDAKAVEGVASKSDDAIKNINEMLDPKNEEGFNNNFGGYSAYITNKLTGNTAKVASMLEKFKSNMKAAGLELFRTGGSIGAMTEKEWPIVQNEIAALSPKMEVEDAREAMKNIAARLQRIKDSAYEIYSDTWGQTQFYRKPKDASSSLDDLLKKYEK